jgi:reverse gyrase
MAYRIRCNSCNHVFTSQYRSACCPRRCHGSSSTSILSDIAELAVDVAVAYVAADIVSDVASSVVSSLFDW